MFYTDRQPAIRRVEYLLLHERRELYIWKSLTTIRWARECIQFLMLFFAISKKPRAPLAEIKLHSRAFDVLFTLQVFPGRELTMVGPGRGDGHFQAAAD